MYHYRVFGLHIISEIALQRLQEYTEADSGKLMSEESVMIEFGFLPAAAKEKLSKTNARYQIEKENVYMQYQSVVSFCVSDGKKILVEQGADYHDELVQELIISNCLAVIFMQRQEITIHGGAVASEKGAIAVSGISGAGKSSLCNELRRRGLKFLADDTVVVHKLRDKEYIYPGFPYTKLCYDTAIRLHYEPEKMTRIDEGRDKYLASVESEFCDEPVQMKALVIVCEDNIECVTLKEIRGSVKLQYLIDALYSYKLYTGLGMDRILMQKHIELANLVPIYLLSRPRGVMTVEQQAEQLLHTIDKICF